MRKRARDRRRRHRARRSGLHAEYRRPPAPQGRQQDAGAARRRSARREGYRMKIAVMGSGGVGGFYGGRLAHAGYDVHFVARGAHLEAMRKQGLSIENKEQGDIHVAKVNVVEEPAMIGSADVVIIAVKLKDTDAAANAVKPIVGPDTAVLSLQNGVIKDDILRKHYAVAQIMGGRSEERRVG